MSEMLTEMVPGQEDSSDLELLQVSRLAEALGLWWQLYHHTLLEDPTRGHSGEVGWVQWLCC